MHKYQMTKKSIHTQTPHVQHSLLALSSREVCTKLFFLAQFHSTLRTNIEPNSSKQNDSIILCVLT